MKSRHTILFLLACVALFAFFLRDRLPAESLWVDHDPYGPAERIAPGMILKVHVDEPVRVSYEYERGREEKLTIKMIPDKKITEFLPGVTSDKSIAGSDKQKIKSRGRIRLKAAVTVTAVDQNGVAQIEGAKVLTYENGRARQEISIAGRVHLNDISDKRVVLSKDIADLRVLLRGEPIKRSRNFQVKQVPGPNPGDPPRPAARLSDREKQTILMEYINRILGEASDR